jgi:alpha-1,2-glucosyltransferase
VLGCFAAFLVRNGAVVLGDREHHAPVVHGAQLLYLTAFASAPYALPELTLRLPATLGAAGRAAASAPLAAAAAAAAVLGAAHLTHCHPFLLADNRHVTFYAWRYVLGVHRAARYALAPAYLLLGWLLYPRVCRAQGALLSLGLLACSVLVLVPTPLLEPRYLTLPALLLRLHAPPLRGPRGWLPPLVLFAAVNLGAVAIFLHRPYSWGDGSVARFMW